MSKKSPPIIEEFKFVDKSFIFSKDLSDLVTHVNSTRIGTVKRKYLGVETHSIKIGNYYVYAEAVLGFSPRTKKEDIARFRRYALEFLETAKRNSYSQD